jgi:hypothetical protein
MSDELRREDELFGALDEVIDAERERPLDDALRAQLWDGLVGAAEQAARRAQRRAALRTVIRSPLARAGALAAFVVLIVVALWLGSLTPRSASGPTVRLTPEARSPSRGRSSAAAPAIAPSPASAPRAPDDAPAAPRALATRPRLRGRRLACGALLERQRGATALRRDSRAGARLELTRGLVQLYVPKLARRARVQVVTPDGVVSVRGTRFTVERTSLAGPTRVRVLQGRVWIDPAGHQRKRVVLHAGQSHRFYGAARLAKLLLRRMDRSILAADYGHAVTLGRRFLEVSDDRQERAEVRLRLAKLHLRRGAARAALRDYRRVARSEVSAAAREQALASWASLLEARGERAAAAVRWREILRRFPKGLHAEEARRALRGMTTSAPASQLESRRR